MHEFLFSDSTDQIALPGLSIAKASYWPAGVGFQATVNRPAIVPLRWAALNGLDAALVSPVRDEYHSGQLARCAELLVQLAASPRISVMAGARCLIQAAACRADVGDARDASRLVHLGLRQLTSANALGGVDSAIGPADWLAFAADAISAGDGDAALTWSVRAARSLRRAAPVATTECSARQLTGDAFAVYGATMILHRKTDAGCEALRCAFQIHSDAHDSEAAAVDLLNIAAAETERFNWSVAGESLRAADLIVQPLAGLPGWPRAGRILSCVQELQRQLPRTRCRNSADWN